MQTRFSLMRRSYSSFQKLKADPVVVTYSQLKDKNSDSVMEQIERAFSHHGLCAIMIQGIPNYTEERKRLLHMSYQLANLPKEELKKLEVPELNYGLGWNPGLLGFSGVKGVKDTLQGSFYGNPF